MKKNYFKLLYYLLFSLWLAIPLNMLAQNNLEDLNAKIGKYIEEGKYLESEILLLQTDSIQRSMSDTLSTDYASTLNHLGYVQAKKGKYQESEILYQKALDVWSNIYGKNSIEYALVLINLAELHIQMQYFDDVQEKLHTAMDIIKGKVGDNNQYYADVLYQLGIFYCFSQQPDEAFNLLDRSAKIYQNLLGENHRKYANAMTAFGTYYFFQTDYILSDQYYSKAIQIFQAGEYKDHPDYLDCLFAKTSLDVTLGKIESAKNTLLEGMDLTIRHFGKEHPNYAGALSNLGSIYYMKEDYKKAEPLLKESLHISSIFFGKKHSFYFNALNMLAVAYMSTGAYELAEPLYLESLSLRKELYGESNQSVFTAINNLANLYILMRNYDKAEKLIKNALEELESLNMEGSVTHALLIIQKASLYEYQNRNEEALKLYEKAANIYKKEFGEDDPNYISLLSNIVYTKSFYVRQASDDIESLWLDILLRQEKILGTNHSNYIGTVNNLAMYYMYSGNYGKSRTLLKKNINALKNTIGEKSLLYQSMLWHLAVNEEITGNSEEAQELCNFYFELKREQVQRFFTFMSEKEREAFVDSFDENLNILYSLYCRYAKESSLTGFIYNYKLLSKSLLLNSSRHLQQSIIKSNNESLIKEWHRLLDVKNELIKLEKQGNEKQKEKEQLEETANLIEKNILAVSKEYNETQQDFSLEWQDIQHSLSNDEVAIEFVNFRIMCPNLVVDTLYCAMIVCPERMKPVMIYLCSDSELHTAIKKSPYDFSAVHTLVWKPLRKYLKGKKSIYIAPSGLLNRVSFANVQKGEYDIHNVLSTKDIPKIKKGDSHKISAFKAVLFGGIDFSLAEKDSLRTAAELDSNLSYNNITSITRSIINEFDPTRGQGFSYLLGSKREVMAIDSILKNRGWNVDLYVDKYATEARFKTYSFLSPEILHISTHGFYYPNPTVQKLRNIQNDNPYKISDNPLIRSGMAFAGANQVWDNKRDAEKTDDGILTAYEISNMDLSNTKLVVLSACKTGLGDIIGNEGIYGLQRAFRLAGVEFMIVSLWDVDDTATLEFMKEFYSLWNNSDEFSIRIAFSETQKILKSKYSKNPEKWAGFILVE